MFLTIPAGTTSKIIEFPIFNSSSNTGALLSGLTYSNCGNCYYNVEGAGGAATSVTLANMTKGTWANGGFIATDGTNMPGVYQLGIPNAALASNTCTTVYLSGATNAVPVVITIQVLPANGAGLPVNAMQWNGSNVATPATAGIPDINVKNVANTTANTTGACLGVNVINWRSNAVPATSISGVPKTDPQAWNGSNVSAPATAGIPDINIKNIANVAVSNTTAQLGVNVIQVANTTANTTGACLGVNVVSGVQYAVKKNTALAKFSFMMSNSSNHAPQSGLGTSNISCSRSIDGGAFAAGSLANQAEVGAGMYTIDFAAADLNGGVITLQANATGCDVTFVTLVTAQ